MSTRLTSKGYIAESHRALDIRGHPDIDNLPSKKDLLRSFCIVPCGPLGSPPKETVLVEAGGVSFPRMFNFRSRAILDSFPMKDASVGRATKNF